LGIFWEKNSQVVRISIENGDPGPIENALRAYHDRVVAAGGVMYVAAEAHARFEAPEKQRLAVAVVALSGNMVGASDRPGGFLGDAEVQRLLALKRAHPALHNLSQRRKLPTAADDKHYAFLRTAADGSERILVVMNFQSTPQRVDVDLSGVATPGLVDLESKRESPRQISFKVELPAYGYRLFQVNPAR
jgi:hypothetical protein